MSKADSLFNKLANINYVNEPVVKKSKPKLSEGTKDILAGLTAGAASTFATYPIDTITTRRQVSGLNTKGGQGLYRGVGLKLLKNVPGTAITLGTYGVTKRILDKYFPEDDVNALAPSTIVNIKPKEEQVDLF